MFYDPRSLDPSGPIGVLHAKAVVVDDEAVFITSANFTEAALDRNIELGVLIRDRAFALTVGGYFLCHAGVRPGVPLERQTEDDLLWIRDEFLKSKTDFGRIVVHGHTPTEEPELLPNRINVDTGAFMTGRLTCAVLEGKAVRFLSANR